MTQQNNDNFDNQAEIQRLRANGVNINYAFIPDDSNYVCMLLKKDEWIEKKELKMISLGYKRDLNSDFESKHRISDVCG